MGDLDLRRRWVLDAPLDVFLIQLKINVRRDKDGKMKHETEELRAERDGARTS